MPLPQMALAILVTVCVTTGRLFPPKQSVQPRVSPHVAPSVAPRLNPATPHRRVVDGDNDTHNVFPYVVSLERSPHSFFRRLCTGSLLTAAWVLTAAHCATNQLERVRYGDMTKEQTTSYSKVLRRIPHHAFVGRDFYSKHFNYTNYKNDIALLVVEKMSTAAYGRLAAADYQTLVGYRVAYAGFGWPNPVVNFNLNVEQETGVRTGEGVAVRCGGTGVGMRGNTALVCVASRCGRRRQAPAPGDSGGPLARAGRLVAVLCGAEPPHTFYFTPVSPYLDWIYHEMTRDQAIHKNPS